MSPPLSPDHRHHPVDIHAYRAWLFDLDGVLTKTAAVHAAAWKQAFDEFLAAESDRTPRVWMSTRVPSPS